MSDLMETPQIFNSKECPVLAPKTHSQRITARTAHVGNDITIRRVLPHQDRKMIDAVTAWNNHTAFGEVEGFQGERLTPPPSL